MSTKVEPSKSKRYIDTKECRPEPYKRMQTRNLQKNADPKLTKECRPETYKRMQTQNL